MWVVLLAPLFIVGAAVVLIRQRRRRQEVTLAWLVDNERRAWGVGVDQTGVQSWPIRRD